jgi:signal-transduction protein with cAMP-binding, CBS, and nucleotidyltransferase domain
MQLVKDLLKKKKQKQVWSINAKATVFDALKLMAENQVGALMVMNDKGKVAGIVTERDYARKIILLGKASKNTKVEEIMTPADKMFHVKPETPTDDCMVLITGKRIRHLPVFEGNKFVGLISIGDLVRAKIDEQEMLIEQLSNYIGGGYT